MVLNVVGSNPTSHPKIKRKIEGDFPLFYYIENQHFSLVNTGFRGGFRCKIGQEIIYKKQNNVVTSSKIYVLVKRKCLWIVYGLFIEN